MDIIRCREEENDYFRIWWEYEDTGEYHGNVLTVTWFNGKLEFSSQAQLISVDEMRYLIQWIQKTLPQPKYRITTIFEDKPSAVVTSDYDWINKEIEVEEVWE